MAEKPRSLEPTTSQRTKPFPTQTTKSLSEPPQAEPRSHPETGEIHKTCSYCGSSKLPEYYSARPNGYECVCQILAGISGSDRPDWGFTQINNDTQKNDSLDVVLSQIDEFIKENSQRPHPDLFQALLEGEVSDRPQFFARIREPGVPWSQCKT